MASKISAVIPLYNKAKHICRALDSILAQELPADEIIVVDDGSTDGGGEVVTSYQDSRIRLITQKNQGVSAARNRGFAEAEGELIAFLDADDEWYPSFLEEILNLQRKYPQAGAFATAYDKITPQGYTIRPQFDILLPRQKQGLINDYYRVILKWPVWSSAVAIPKVILHEIGGFKVGEAYGEDIDVWLRIALRYQIAWSGKSLACYHKDAENRADRVNPKAVESAILKTLQSTIEANLGSPEEINSLKELTAYFQLDSVSRYLLLGNKAKAAELLKCASGTKLYKKNWWKLRILYFLPKNWYKNLKK
jgi:glycosyltransferase involved in cell wall biosynthesis